MTPEQHEKAMQVFNEAVGLAVEDRAAFVDNACGGDAIVKAEVDSLMAHDAGPGSELDSPALGSDFDLNRIAETRSAEHEQPQRIGPYRILDKLGEGGMGIVYLAKQTEPVRRRVALKLIKPGMDSREVIARFESERQALAMMSHPNVARVFDAGVSEQGRPYFVMELVEGLRITEHCDRHRLSIEERIDLFVRVCEAVQHAHQKGIIHRDLKPGNILVECNDGVATPKVIDFGVAKAMEQRLTEKTLFTHRGQLVGTPEYMSPEQAEMSGQDIDTRSDIYSLG
ncbi:MAG: serine/threonine-protein kinase, partial [Planctomycetota bacterium]